MMRSIKEDEKLRPQLFDWRGEIDLEIVRAWTAQRGWKLPADLLLFLSQTGGGDFFESETILAPVTGVTPGDGIDESNADLARRGLPSGHLVFHVGLALSAVRLDDQQYICFSPLDFSTIGRYSSLRDWYERFIRAEYEERYKLPALARPYR